MTLFEFVGWSVVVALLAGGGWLIDGERGAGLASLAAPILIAAILVRSRRSAASAEREAVAWEPQARWTLTRGQALVEAWSRGAVRLFTALLVVCGLPGAIALVTRDGPPIAIRWRWGALIIGAAVAPLLVVFVATLARAVAGLRHRERSVRWTNSELSVRMAGGDWSAPRSLLRRTAWRDVMIVSKDAASEDVVAMPLDIAVRAGLGRETEPHGASLA